MQNTMVRGGGNWPLGKKMIEMNNIYPCNCIYIFTYSFSSFSFILITSYFDIPLIFLHLTVNNLSPARRL